MNKAEYQKQYQANPANHARLKETKRNSANAKRRLEALLKIKEAMKPVNQILGGVKRNDTH